MSLVVYLMRKKWISYDAGKTLVEEQEELFWKNITHNLGRMADKAGIYEVLWRPFMLHEKYKNPKENSEYDYEFENSTEILASSIIDKLEKGLKLLKSKPAYFKKYNPDNNWGSYEGLLEFVKEYLKICKEYPESFISVSR